MAQIECIISVDGQASSFYNAMINESLSPLHNAMDSSMIVVLLPMIYVAIPDHKR